MEDLIAKVAQNDETVTELGFGILLPGTSEDQQVRLFRALQRNPHVRTLRWPNPPPPLALRELCLAFRRNTSIQDARLIGWTNDQFSEIAEALFDNTTVQSLDLGLARIQGRAGGEIVRDLLLNSQSIQKLKIDDNTRLGSEGAAAIAQGLADDRCVLQELNLAECRIGNDGIRDVCNALRGNVTLVKLNVGGNNITWIGLQCLVDLLQVNTSIESLDLFLDELNDDRPVGGGTAGGMISAMLEHNTSLKELYVRSCDLEQSDSSLIFRSLTRNNTLTELSVDDVSPLDLANCLPDIASLQCLAFSFPEGVSNDVLQQFLCGLHKNKSLVSIDGDHFLEGENVQLWETWTQFVAARNKMLPALVHGKSVATSDTIAAASLLGPVPTGLLPFVLHWCDQHDEQRTPEAKASLSYYALRMRTNDNFGGPSCRKHPMSQEEIND